MKKIRWSDYKTRIPTHVRIKDVEYEILYTNDFKDGETLGETRLNTKQIVLKTNETDKETVHTYIHECLHAVSEEFDVGLTETQVRKLEKSLTNFLTSGNIFLNPERKLNATKQRSRKNTRRLR